MQPKNHRASILVVTLIILGIVLVSALSFSVVALQKRKSALGTGNSAKAYQIAETGLEKVMNTIVKGSGTVRDIAGSVGATCNSAGLIEDAATGYQVELKQTNGTQISCNSLALANTVNAIKSTGTASGESRAIEAAVAANLINYSDGKVCWTIRSYTNNSNSNGYQYVISDFYPADNSWKIQDCAFMAIHYGGDAYGIGCTLPDSMLNQNGGPGVAWFNQGCVRSGSFPGSCDYTPWNQGAHTIDDPGKVVQYGNVIAPPQNNCGWTN